MSELTYQDYLDRVDIQEVLVDAGYHLNRRDGLRYPSYVALDSQGRRIPGDKFLVTPNGKCCFHPPVLHCWNVISFIKEHPELFKDYRPGMSPDRLVNLVCCRLLNQPADVRESHVLDPKKDGKSFDLSAYDITVFNDDDMHTRALFDRFFSPRGISTNTQKAFQRDFIIVTHDAGEYRNITNLAFPLEKPGDKTTTGLEVRGMVRSDGSSFKGLAQGTDATHSVWIGNPGRVSIDEASDVYWFESAYDAIAYYQLKVRSTPELMSSLFVSTSGNPSYGQQSDMIKICPTATHHLCFDNDLAGKQFSANFIDIARRNGYECTGDTNILNGFIPNDAQGIKELSVRREIPKEGCKDWNEELLDKPSLGVRRVFCYTEENGRKLAFEKTIPPDMLRYMDSLKDKTDVLSGDRSLLPRQGKQHDFKTTVLSFLGIPPPSITSPPTEETSTSLSSTREITSAHIHR